MRLGIFCTMLVAMMIFLQFLGLPTGLDIVLTKVGIDINTNSTATPAIVNTDIEGSDMWDWIFGSAGILVLIIGVGAIVVGLFAKSYDTSLVVLPLLISVAELFITTFSTLIKYTQSLNQDWMTALVVTIFGSLSVAFLWSVLDYFRSG